MRKILVTSLLLVCAVLALTLSVYAYSVPMRSDNRLCDDVGLLGGLSSIAQPAGRLYYLNLKKAQTLNVPIGNQTFDVSYYDNDGSDGTGYDYRLAGKSTYSMTIKTANNDWSGWYQVRGADQVILRPPADHNSTWICFSLSKSLIPTPPTAPTAMETPGMATPTATPQPDTIADVGVTVHASTGEAATNLTPAPEIMPDSIDFAPPGYTVTLRVNIFNAGNIPMPNVRVFGPGLDYTVLLMQPGAQQTLTVIQYLQPGTNRYDYTVTSTEPDDVFENNRATVVVEADECGKALPLDALEQYLAICGKYKVDLPLVRR